MINKELTIAVKDIERKQRRGEELTKYEIALYKLYGGEYAVDCDD